MNLDHLGSEERSQVLGLLLERHPELRDEANAAAKDLLDDVSVEGVAADVSIEVRYISPEAFESRAGSHSWGYVDPTDAAWELLEEAVEEFKQDMTRRIEAGSERAAESICMGIVIGLYEVREAETDGPLEWAPDFPEAAARQALAEYLAALPEDKRAAAGLRIESRVVPEVPGWGHMVLAAVDGAVDG